MAEKNNKAQSLISIWRLIRHVELGTFFLFEYKSKITYWIIYGIAADNNPDNIVPSPS